MFFGFWQLKTTVFALLLTSCLGHELLRACHRDYCYERSIERGNIDTNNLRKLFGVENRRADTRRETENLRENRLDQINSESNREIRQELKTLTENRRELVEQEPSRREPYGRINENRNLFEMENSRVTADEGDFNSRVDETSEILHSAKLVFERRQETHNKQNSDRFVMSLCPLNEREHQQERNEFRDKKQETYRFNDRQHDLLQRGVESQTEREINDLSRQSRRSSDRTSEREYKLIQRREPSQAELLNRETHRLNTQLIDTDAELLLQRHKSNEERSVGSEDFTRNQNDHNETPHETERKTETRGFNERISEKEREIHFEPFRRQRESDGNINKSRRLSLSEDDFLEKYESRLDGRERKNHRSTESLSERTEEQTERRESVKQRDNLLQENREVRQSNDRLYLTERLTEQHENLRRLNEPEPLDQIRRSMQQLSERRQETMQRREVNRQEGENRELGRSSSRLSDQEETLRRLNEREKIESENERGHDFKSHDENRESRKSSQRIIEREERNVQRRVSNDMERERKAEANVRNNDNRRISSRQLDNQEPRYDENNRLRERELTFTERQDENIRGREDNRRQFIQREPAITQEHINAAFNRRQQRRYDNSPEREDVLNSNRDSQRSSERLTESDEEQFENRNEVYHGDVNHVRNSRRSEQRNINRVLDENRNSRHIDERRDEDRLLDANILSRRSSLYKNVRESVQQLDGSYREFETRHAELRELGEREDKHDINRASDRRSFEIQQSRQRIIENTRERDTEREHDPNSRLETRKSSERQDEVESIQGKDEKVLQRTEDTELRKRHVENVREQNERENQRFETRSNRNVENRRNFEFIVGEYEEAPKVSFKNSNMAYIQGVLLAFVVMKTLNGKNNIKCQVSKKLQEAVAILGF